MSHTPYGYRIENGLAVINQEEAAIIRSLYAAYLDGATLAAAAQKAGLKATHSVAGLILKNKHYTGDDYYPAIIDIDTSNAAKAERNRRAERLGRNKDPEPPKEIVYPFAFYMKQGTEQFDSPFEQAEYIYSLIEIEVNPNGSE